MKELTVEIVKDFKTPREFKILNLRLAKKAIEENDHHHLVQFAENVIDWDKIERGENDVG